MKIAIVEDDKEAQDLLISCIKRYEQEHKLHIEILTYNDGVQITSDYPSNLDLIYFDVQMPVMDGMTAAKKVREHDQKVLIVFLTNYVQYAIDGYEVQAADFLLKPITYFSFSAHFDKLLSRLQTDEKFITVTHDNEMNRIPLNQLYYVESAGHYIKFHLANKEYQMIGSLKNMEKQLDSDHFFRCNYGYLVNLGQVSGVDGNTVHVGPFDLQISRSRKKSFMAHLTDYLGTEEL